MRRDGTGGRTSQEEREGNETVAGIAAAEVKFIGR